MNEVFKLEIISPEKIIFSDNVNMVTLPSYEGDMSVLKNHISIITFLRPGIVKVLKDTQNFNEFFIQDGTVEANDQLLGKDINDHERYVLNTKLNVLKEVRL